MDKNKLFDDKKCEETLKKCLQRAKSGKTDYYPCLFAMGGKEPMFVLDFDGSVKRERFLKEARDRGHNKLMLGKACINGTSAEIQKEEEKGGTIKIEHIRKHLKKYKITKAKFMDKNGKEISDDPENPQ